MFQKGHLGAQKNRTGRVLPRICLCGMGVMKYIATKKHHRDPVHFFFSRRDRPPREFGRVQRARSSEREKSITQCRSGSDRVVASRNRCDATLGPSDKSFAQFFDHAHRSCEEFFAPQLWIAAGFWAHLWASCLIKTGFPSGKICRTLSADLFFGWIEFVGAHCDATQLAQLTRSISVVILGDFRGQQRVEHVGRKDKRFGQVECEISFGTRTAMRKCRNTMR